METSERAGIEKLETGIPGFDFIAYGGLPKGRTTLVTGTAGSAKTVFAAQFLAEGIIKSNEPGVFVTFEESPADIRRNMAGFGWDIEKWEAEGRWAFVDASPQPDQEEIVSGSYDLGALLARLEHAMRKMSARRLSMDSLGAIFSQFADSATVRSELFRISSAVKRMDVTAVMTAECVLMVLKMRGSMHNKDICEFLIDAKGMYIGKPFRGVNGILAGNPRHFTASEADRLMGLFRDE